MQRREFLTAGVASAALVSVDTRVHAATAEAHSQASFGRARFESWLDHEFHLTAQGALRGFPARLVAVDNGPPHAGPEQFTVVFHGSSVAPTGLCWFSHPAGAHFALHLHGSPGSPARRAYFCLEDRRDG